MAATSGGALAVFKKSVLTGGFVREGCATCTAAKAMTNPKTTHFRIRFMSMRVRIVQGKGNNSKQK
jgi:hypothetical protein